MNSTQGAKEPEGREVSFNKNKKQGGGSHRETRITHEQGWGITAFTGSLLLPPLGCPVWGVEAP